MSACPLPPVIAFAVPAKITGFPRLPARDWLDGTYARALNPFRSPHVEYAANFFSLGLNASRTGSNVYQANPLELLE